MDAAEVAERFALGRGARLADGPSHRGKQGVVRALDTADGRWAVKVPFDPGTEDDVRGTTRFQEAARAAGVPTPAVRRTVEGRVFATIDDTRVRVHEWVELRPPDPHLDPHQVGAVVAAIHQITAEIDGRTSPWLVEPVGGDRWDDLVGRLRQARAPFAEPLSALRDELVALEAWITAPEAIQMCHRDLWADNLRSTAAGDLCVIDWDDSGPGDPSQELACVLFEFGRTDPGRARALTDAYRGAGGPGAVTRPRHFSTLIAALGHITEAAALDWLQPSPRSPQRAESAACVAEALDEPHTREVLRALLAATGGDGTPGRGP